MSATHITKLEKFTLFEQNILECVAQYENFKTWLDKIPEIFSRFTEIDYAFYEVYPIEKSDAYKFLNTLSPKTILELYDFGTLFEVLCLKEFLAKLISKNFDLYTFEDKTIIYDNFRLTIPDNEIIRILKYALHEKPGLCETIPENLLKKFDYNPTFREEFNKYFNIRYNYIRNIVDIDDDFTAIDKYNPVDVVLKKVF